MSLSNFFIILSVTSSRGQTAPIPPVLGPFAPSKRRLWSRAGRNGTIVAEPLTANSGVTETAARTEISTPSRYSSITSFLPASPTLPLPIISSTAASACSTVAATTTPLPAARPSAFTTIGAPCFLIYSQASSLLVKVSLEGQATPYSFMNFLERSLLPSS